MDDDIIFVGVWDCICIAGSNASTAHTLAHQPLCDHSNTHVDRATKHSRLIEKDCSAFQVRAEGGEGGEGGYVHVAGCQIEPLSGAWSSHRCRVEGTHSGALVVWFVVWLVRLFGLLVLAKFSVRVCSCETRKRKQKI